MGRLFCGASLFWHLYSSISKRKDSCLLLAKFISKIELTKINVRFD